MGFIRKIKGSLVKQDIDTYVGESTYLFYDTVTGELRIWDGTPGGIPIFGSGGGGGDEINIRAFIGKNTDGPETPLYASSNQITQNATLETTIGELDLALGLDLAGNTIITAGDSSNHAIQVLADFVEEHGQVTTETNVTTITLVDSVIADMAKWVIRVEDVATPSNVYATEMIATHDGTSLDSAKYAILKLGSNINGLDITVTLTGGNTLNVNVESTDAVNVVIKRIMVV